MDAAMNHDSIIPLYAQVEEQLKRDIENGVYSKNGRIPTEAELAKQYNVSRITVRRAVEDLVSQGLVEKKQGKGTFVRKVKYMRDSRTLSSFTESCRDQGMIPGGRTLEKSTVVLNPKIARRLEQAPGSQGIYMSRLRFADREPVIIERNYFPMKYAFLMEQEFDNNSLFEFLKETYQVTVTRSDKEIEMCRATNTEAELLKVPVNAPLILVKSTAYVQTGEPIYVGTQVMNGERFTLQITQGIVL